jgi:hypothetical protein
LVREREKSEIVFREYLSVVGLFIVEDGEVPVLGRKVSGVLDPCGEPSTARTAVVGVLLSVDAKVNLHNGLYSLGY